MDLERLAKLERICSRHFAQSDARGMSAMFPLDDVNDLTLAYRAARAKIAELEAATQWQPIATAPKDGTMIVLLAENTAVNVGSYSADSYNQWRWRRVNGGRIAPTHWQPLPQPPQPATGQG